MRFSEERKKKIRERGDVETGREKNEIFLKKRRGKKKKKRTALDIWKSLTEGKKERAERDGKSPFVIPKEGRSPFRREKRKKTI